MKMSNPMLRLAIPEPVARSRKGIKTKCVAQGCIKKALGKPYCPDHIHLHPYVAKLLDEIRSRAEEVERVRAGGVVRQNGAVYREVLATAREMHEGSVGLLARECGVVDAQMDLIEIYVKSMAKRGILTLRHSKRGYLTFRFNEPAGSMSPILSKKTALAS